ncbi:MAG: hypothetical protein HRU15_14515 [Planctomycetes bacterium]|nr:hypothetical protein [Planctomycetota bacterium]
MVETTLIILILFTNPAIEVDAQSFAEKLNDYATVGLTVKIGKDAQAALIERIGISTADLLAAGGIGKTLTKQQGNIVIIHIDKSEMKGDVIAEARLWFDGRDEKFVAISGNGGDPVPSLVAGTGRMLDYKLRQAAGDVVATHALPLSQLVKQKAWAQLLGRIAEIKPEERAPVQLYYQIMAYVNMSDRNEAVRSLNVFRDKYPKHLLVTSAESLIPPRKMSDAELLGVGSDHSLDPLAIPDKVDAATESEKVGDKDFEDKETELNVEQKKIPELTGPPLSE